MITTVLLNKGCNKGRLKRIMNLKKHYNLKAFSTLKRLLISVGFMLSPVLVTGEDGNTHICFFEFDNTVSSENLVKNLGITTAIQNKGYKSYKDTNKKAIIHTFQPEDTKANRNLNSAFENMIKSGQKCNSLVLSGHHTGEWFGKKGHLYLKDLEKLSCNPEYKDWFSNIKALWLDGCNTVTDGFIKASEADTTVSEEEIQKTADSEAVRVGSKSRLSKGTEHTGKYFNFLNQSYSGTLDENTTLSSRYLRMFPSTQIYGFNGPAPLGSEVEGNLSHVYNHLTALGTGYKNRGGAKSKSKKILT